MYAHRFELRTLTIRIGNADPQIVDRVSGKAVTERDFAFRPGSAATPEMKRRYGAR